MATATYLRRRGWSEAPDSFHAYVEQALYDALFAGPLDLIEQIDTLDEWADEQRRADAIEREMARTDG